MSVAPSQILAQSREAHRWVGVILGCAILFAMITGTVTTMHLQLIVYERPEVRTAAQEMPGSWAGIDSAWRRAVERAPGQDINVNIDQLHLPNHAWQISFFNGDGVGHQIVADPVTGAQLGKRESPGGREFLIRLHSNLWLGDLGRFLQSMAGIFMGVLVVTGIYLHRNLFKQMFSFRRSPSRNFWSSTHKLLAVWTLPFQGAIAVSGAMFGGALLAIPLALIFAKGDVDLAVAEVLGAQPEEVEIAGEPITLDDAFAIARTAMPDIDDGEGLAGIPRVAIRNVNTGAMMFEFRGQGGQVHIHGYTGEIINVLPGAAAPLAVLSQALMDFHLAEYAGAASLLMHLVLGCLTVALPVSGLFIWYQTKTRQGSDTEVVRALARPMSAAIGFSGAALAACLLVMFLGRVLPPSMPLVDLFFWLFYGTVGAGLGAGLLLRNPRATWQIMAMAIATLLVAMIVADITSGADGNAAPVSLHVFRAGCSLLAVSLLYSLYRDNSPAPGAYGASLSENT